MTTTMTATGRKVTLHFAYEVRCVSGLAFRDAWGTIQPTLTLANGDECTSGNMPITYSATF